MPDIREKKIAILATNGFEQSELEVPLKKLRDAGAAVDVVSPEAGEIKGWDRKDWGRPVKVDKTLGEVSASDYDAIVLPGGQLNPDYLRVNPDAIAFIRDFYTAGKTVAAICHAPWLLIEAGIIQGRRATSYKSIKTDVINAGGQWVDEEVVTDDGLITSRQPSDLEAFTAKIVEEVNEGKHERRFAAPLCVPPVNSRNATPCGRHQPSRATPLLPSSRRQRTCVAPRRRTVKQCVSPFIQFRQRRHSLLSATHHFP